MKKLTCQIACYTSLFFLIFACEDATEADMSKLSSANDYSLTNSSPSSDQTIRFTFNKTKIPNGKYKVGTNSLTGSKLFITLERNEVVQVMIQTKHGFTIELDPVQGPTGPSGKGHLEFMCVNPEVVKIFKNGSTAKTSSKLPKYTIYVVPEGCKPQSNVLLILMDPTY